MHRYIRNKRERDAFVDKRLWVGRQLGIARAVLLRDESGLRVTAPSLALRYDFLRPELRRKDKITANVTNYWLKKAADPTFHAGSHGGHRHDKFSEDGWAGAREIVLTVIWRQINAFPESQLPILTSVANEAIALIAGARGLAPKVVSQRWVARVFEDWRWSWKVPTVVQLHKFTNENIERYINYVVFVAGIPLRRLKFVDEIHFVSRGSPFLVCPLPFAL
jgi:hypothetical protein